MPGLVVRGPISANSVLNLNLGFYITLLKSRLEKFSPYIFRAFNHQIEDKKSQAEFSFQAFRF